MKNDVKTMIKRLFSSCLLLVAMGGHLWADCRLSLVPVSVDAGARTTLMVNLTNTEEVTAFQFDLRLPQGISIPLTMNEDDEQVLDAQLTERKKSSHRITCSQQSDGRYTVAVLSGTNQSLKNSEGAVVNIGIMAQGTLASGSYIAQMENIHIVPLKDGKPGERIDQDNIEGTVNVNNSTQGEDVVAVLKVDTKELTAGSDGQIKIALENNLDITSIQFDVTLPAGINVKTVQNEDGDYVLDAQLSSRKKSSHQISCEQQENGCYRVVVISMKNQALSGNEGTIVTLGVSVPLTMSGNFDVRLSNIHLMPLVGGAPGIRIDGNDVVQSINVSNQGSGEEPQGPMALTVAPLTMKPGETSTLYINMTNDREVCTFQLKVVLPQGLTVVKEYNEDDEYVEAISLTSRKKSSHDLTFKHTDDGGYFLLAYSTSNAAFKGNSGELVAIKVKADDQMQAGTYGVVLKDALMITPDEQRFVQQDYSAPITITTDDSIGTLDGTANMKVKWFDLQGRPAKTSQGGVLIRRIIMSNGNLHNEKVMR
jgi:hypothetical protein